MEKLKLSSDRKVSPRSSWYTTSKGKKVAKPKIPNSFGLPAGDSCPGMTDFCTSCYAYSIERMYTNVSKLLWHNFNLLKACGSNVSKMVDLLDEMIKSINWRGEPKIFRIHWDGDYHSKPYTVAWAQTCRLNPDVIFWVYTRSVDWVDGLLDISNLAVYLSTDQFNKERVKEVYKQHPQLMIAACADSWEETETLMREVVGRNAPRCPVLTGKIPMVSEDGVGGCVRCEMCLYSRNHVRFSSKH